MKIPPRQNVLIPKNVARLTQIYNYYARTLSKTDIETVTHMLEGVIKVANDSLKPGASLLISTHTGGTGTAVPALRDLLLEAQAEKESEPAQSMIDTGVNLKSSIDLVSALRAFARVAKKADRNVFSDLTAEDCISLAARVAVKLQDRVREKEGHLFVRRRKTDQITFSFSFPCFVK